MPGVANSKLIKHTQEEALRNPELANTGVANGSLLSPLISLFLWLSTAKLNSHSIPQARLAR